MIDPVPLFRSAAEFSSAEPEFFALSVGRIGSGRAPLSTLQGVWQCCMMGDGVSTKRDEQADARADWQWFEDGRGWSRKSSS